MRHRHHRGGARDQNRIRDASRHSWRLGAGDSRLVDDLDVRRHSCWARETATGQAVSGEDYVAAGQRPGRMDREKFATGDFTPVISQIWLRSESPWCREHSMSCSASVIHRCRIGVVDDQPLEVVRPESGKNSSWSLVPRILVSEPVLNRCRVAGEH